MKELKAKVIKRHMLRTYEFWQLDEKFLLVSPDKKLFSQEAFASLPESETGYLAYAYLDETMKVAFLGPADPEKGTYDFFDKEEVLVLEAASLPQMLVRLVKGTDELNLHPFVQSILDFHRSKALERASLALRSLDPLRDPLEPGTLTACFIRDEARKEKAFEEESQAYAKALEAIISDGKGEVTERLDELKKPDVAEEEINFVKIKDLIPSNGGSWRATLLDKLPGTRLKKKGDPVDISMVIVTEEEKTSTLLFVNHTAPVQGSDISVQAYKPARLPWRLAYEMACEHCDYKETFRLGRQGDDSRLFSEILDDIRKGDVDPLILIDLVQGSEGELDFSRELYRCRHCGNLEVKNRLRLVSSDKTLSAPYNCSNCGERMTQVKRGQIASIDCPQCRKPLNLLSEKQWTEKG